jgi:carbonic anhydrase/acetyltransferase-like protein (isoleucine patch superfamily)
VTYDAMVRAGCKVGENAVVGARAVVQTDVPAHHIAVGMPAKSVKIKPGFEDEAVPIEEANEHRQEDREIPYDLPPDVERFDEFQRPPRYSEPVQPHREP